MRTGGDGTAEKCLTQSSRRAQRRRSGKQRRKLIQSIYGTRHQFHFSSLSLPPAAADFGSILSNSPAIVPLATSAGPPASPPLHTFSQRITEGPPKPKRLCHPPRPLRPTRPALL